MDAFGHVHTFLTNISYHFLLINKILFDLNSKLQFNMSQVIIKFNIGGKVYQVSQSLLDSYPDSMLAKSGNDKWHKDPEAEIFIERDGERFRYVLDYMRDGKVSLPPSVTKASLIMDLQYYGLTVVESSIDDTLLIKYTSALAYPTCTDAANEIYEPWRKQLAILSKCQQAFDRYRDFKRYPNTYSNIMEVDSLIVDLPLCNQNLKQVGLRLEFSRKYQRKRYLGV